MSAPTRLSPSNPAYDLEQFAAGHPAGLRCAGAGRMRRIEHVDVDRDVERMVARWTRVSCADDVVDMRVSEFAAVHDR